MRLELKDDSGNNLESPLQGVAGAAKVYLASLLAGEDTTLGRLLSVAGALKSVAITANGTTIIKNTRGILLGIIATNAGTSWTVQAFDGLSGAGQALTPNLAVTAGNVLNNYFNGGLGPICDTGICLVTAGTTPGSLYALFV